MSEMIGATVPGEPVYRLPPFSKLSVQQQGWKRDILQLTNAAFLDTGLTVRGQPAYYTIDPKGATHLWPTPDGHYPLAAERL